MQIAVISTVRLNQWGRKLFFGRSHTWLIEWLAPSLLVQITEVRWFVFLIDLWSAYTVTKSNLARYIWCFGRPYCTVVHHSTRHKNVMLLYLGCVVEHSYTHNILFDWWLMAVHPPDERYAFILRFTTSLRKQLTMQEQFKRVRKPKLS